MPATSPTSAEPSLSRFELVALARLLGPSKPPAPAGILDSLRRVAFPETTSDAVHRTLAKLLELKLIDARRVLTAAGHHMLRVGFGSSEVQTWKQVRESFQASLRDADARIAKALGLPPGHYTLNQLRVHVLSLHPPKAPPPPLPPPPPQPPQRDLLAAVRAAIPRVPLTGRYGHEKVFVSALWNDLQVADLPLDTFKRWLVGANRDGQLVLARADVPAKMDAALVQASEIHDQGGTFHFVLDQQPNGRSVHAR